MTGIYVNQDAEMEFTIGDYFTLSALTRCGA